MKIDLFSLDFLRASLSIVEMCQCDIIPLKLLTEVSVMALLVHVVECHVSPSVYRGKDIFQDVGQGLRLGAFYSTSNNAAGPICHLCSELYNLMTDIVLGIKNITSSALQRYALRVYIHWQL